MASRLYSLLCPSVRRLVGRSVVIELESVKTCISAPAHPSATGIGRVSGLVSIIHLFIYPFIQSFIHSFIRSFINSYLVNADARISGSQIDSNDRPEIVIFGVGFIGGLLRVRETGSRQ